MNTAYVVEWVLNNVRSMEAFPDIDAAQRFSRLVSDMRPQIHELPIRTETFLRAVGLPCAAACGCPEGMCASEPNGCRMVDEVRRNAGVQ